MAGTQVFKDPSRLTTAVVVALVLGVIVALATIASQTDLVFFLHKVQSGSDFGGESIESLAEAIYLRNQRIQIATIILVCITGTLILVWIYRVNANAHAMGALGLKFTPGWAVGWYFIPVANLFKPYQAMAETWKVSANPMGWQAQTNSPLLPIWWTLWIVIGTLDLSVLRTSGMSTEIDAFVVTTTLAIFIEILRIGLNVVFILIAIRIRKMQSETRIRAGAALAFE